MRESTGILMLAALYFIVCDLTPPDQHWQALAWSFAGATTSIYGFCLRLLKL
jgi:hypothetical protein